MSFILKCLLMFVVLSFVNCDTGNSHTKSDNVDIDTLPSQSLDFIEPIDSISHLNYSWKEKITPNQTIQSNIKTPENFRRIEVEKGSFADWLRHLPLKEVDSKVHLFNGDLKGNQSVHAAVIDIDVGNRDLQQCADAVMRLRAEYFYGIKDFSKIHFNFTSGDKVAFTDWMNGRKPVVSGNSVKFTPPRGNVNDSYANFRKYLVSVFSYAGTASLSNEMENILTKEMEIGDVFIKGGFPGHAVIIVDMAINDSGEKLFMIAQSYMPAQEMHVLKNIDKPSVSPWYSASIGEALYSPEWTFSKSDLKRFID